MLLRSLAWLTASALFAAPAVAEVHDVKMLNRGPAGAMVFEPDHLHIAPGDTVRFLPTQSGHNAATLADLLPAGATPFKSPLNQVHEQRFDAPGLYGVQCIPHLGMGMVMLIQVGAASTPAWPESLPARARSRLDAQWQALEAVQ